jgi:hypothetical protein
MRRILNQKRKTAIAEVFTLEVQSDNAGTSGTNQFTIPTSTGTYLYDYTTSDGQSGTGITGDETITFASGVGTYEIYITGTFPKIYFNNSGDKDKLLRVLTLGDYGDGDEEQFAAFRGCSNLTSVEGDAGNLNLVTIGSNMFISCVSLTSLPSGMTLASLTQGESMFYGCTSLTSLPSGMVLDSLINGSSMFQQCTGLTSLPSGMTVDILTNGSSMFYGCTSLTSLPSGMVLDSLINGSGMFREIPITSLPSGMVLDSLTNGYIMFYQCTSLTSLPSGMTLDILTNGSHMFRETNITSLPSGMVLDSLITGFGMFQQVTINTTRYSQLLVDLENLNPNNSVTLEGGNSQYNSTGETARDILTGGTRNWTITDGGLV